MYCLSMLVFCAVTPLGFVGTSTPAFQRNTVSIFSVEDFNLEPREYEAGVPVTVGHT